MALFKGGGVGRGHARLRFSARFVFSARHVAVLMQTRAENRAARSTD